VDEGVELPLAVTLDIAPRVISPALETVFELYAGSVNVAIVVCVPRAAFALVGFVPSYNTAVAPPSPVVATLTASPIALA
jgi:hypothetical protein